MSVIESVNIHASQFPDRVLRDYLQGFINRQIHHKFHYDSAKQSQKWIELHNTYSPAKNKSSDENSEEKNERYVDAYDHCVSALADRLNVPFNLFALGCGDGEKERQLLLNPRISDRVKRYFPIDVSVALAIMASQAAKSVVPHVDVHPYVCDLSGAADLLQHINAGPEARVLTFFGMIPNFAPKDILPILSSYLRDQDYLLFSANLAPGDCYHKAVDSVVSQYDNDLTKEWLQTILLDAGVDLSAGALVADVKTDSDDFDLSRISIDFEVQKPVTFSVYGEQMVWEPGETIQLFYSYRYTTERLSSVLEYYGIKVLEFWESDCAEEGVYLCQKTT